MTGARLDLASLVPASDLAGDDDEDRTLRLGMLKEARDYLSSKKWCKKIAADYFGFGVGGVIALFLFQIDNAASPSDEYLWVVVGDIPSAYFVVDASQTPIAAISTCVSLMQEWVDAAVEGRDAKDVYPVAAERTVENAELLASRLEFIRREVLRGFERAPS